MCDINAYFLKDDNEQLLLANVDRICEQGVDEFKLSNIFGEEKIVTGKFVYYDNAEKKIVISSR